MVVVLVVAGVDTLEAEVEVQGLAVAISAVEQDSVVVRFNGRMGHIVERHDANWHRDWDRRHVHFFRNRFFVFDDGFWFGVLSLGLLLSVLQQGLLRIR